MLHKVKVYLFCLLFSVSVVSAQESLHQFIGEESVEKAFDLFNNKVYDAAYDAFADILAKRTALSDTDYLLFTKVMYYKALCRVFSNSAISVDELKAFAVNEIANPYINEANIEIAQYHYQNEEYEDAISYYSEVDLDDLSNDRYSEIHFNKAYSHFVRKDFGVAISLLKRILHLRDDNYFASNYYYGMSHYFLDDLDEAVLSFQKLSEAPAYKNRIPYYITQILFKQRKYDELLDYTNLHLDNKSTEKLKDIRGILGQTYFIKKDYPQAIEHLQYYASNTQKLRAEDFYQLGFAYYQTKQYSKSIEPFKEIANVQDKMGQNANNYLANSYLETSNKDAARTAFKRTSEMSFIPDLSEEALFNYGKLSSDMGLDREALNSLKKVKTNSVYFAEAQKILSHTLNNTEDYSEAIRFIEELDMQSPPIKASYQRLCYTYGMQFLLDGNNSKAVEYFKKADTYPLDNTINALTYYRLANIDYDKGLHEQSIGRLNQYFSLSKTGIQLPEDADLAYGNYLQAYNYLKLEDYTVARKYFEEASEKLKLQPKRKKLTMDALLRTADCYFRINSYNSAIKYYNLAIETEEKGGDYALYQRGILQGLLGKPFEKIVTMDELIEKHPSSPLVDFAIFQNGETLQAIGEASEAERSFRRIVDEFKKSTLRNRSLLKLGLIAFNQGNVTTSISYYKELFNHNPSAAESQEAMIALEEIYVETLSKPDEFFTFVENQGGFKMSSFEKDSISFRSGDIQFENAEYEKAISAYSRYIKNYPQGFNRIIAHYRRGDAFSLEKRFSEALNDYEYVVKQGESKYYLKALEKGAIISYNSVEDYKKAFDYYSLLEEIEQDPEKQYTYQMGALRSASRIADSKAIRYMGERVLANIYLSQEDKSLAMFYLGKVNYSEDKWADAESQFQQVIALSDNVFTAEARFLLADILYEKQDLQQAEAYCRQAIADSKPYPFWVAKSMLLLSDVFVSNKDLLQAKAALKAIIENFNSDEEILKSAQSKLNTVLEIEAEMNRVDADTSKELQMDNSGNN